MHPWLHPLLARLSRALSPSCSLRLATWRWRLPGPCCSHRSIHPEAPGTSNRTPSRRSCSSLLAPGLAFAPPRSRWCARPASPMAAGVSALLALHSILAPWARLRCWDPRSAHNCSSFAVAGVATRHLLPRSVILPPCAPCIPAKHPASLSIACAQFHKPLPISRCACRYEHWHTCKQA